MNPSVPPSNGVHIACTISMKVYLAEVQELMRRMRGRRERGGGLIVLRSLSLTIDAAQVRLRLSSERDKRGIEGKSSNLLMRITLTLIKNAPN